MNLIDRFLHYVSLDTQSDELTNMTPSTPGQMKFARELAEELKRIGLSEITLDDNGYLMATLPANTDKDVPVIGFIAHLDTSPEMSGHHVSPRIVKSYDGNDIVLNAEKNIVLRPAESPELLRYVGQDLIVTDGNTLLGADDKAGIAEIITAMEYLLAHPEIKHGKIRIGFTPDEEVGRGVDFFDVKAFGADFAYTVDGGMEGELEYENFNAASGDVTFRGVGVHPGSAKNKMISAMLVGMEFHAMLPADETPAHTEGYEGFFHLSDISGNVEQARLSYIIRDHDREKFERRKQLMQELAQKINETYGAGTAELTVRDSYYNMKEKLTGCMFLITHAEQAMQKTGITPIISPIRGGTDGARLSYEGLPCPNLCTGGENFHGRFEYIPVEDMESIVRMLVELCRSFTE